MQTEQPLISVIIPAYNAQKDLESCLDSLKKQTYRPLEIIVIDDGSTDRTLKITKQFWGIKYFSQAHRGPGQARNRGALKAKGLILVFVDADMTFDQRFIVLLTKPIITGTTIGTFTKDEFVANPGKFWSANWSLYRGFAKGRMHPQNYPVTQPVFRAILKQKFLSVGGFTASVGYTDDWTLAKKLGVEASLARGAVIYHRNPETFREAFRQAKWMAKRPYKLGIIGRIFSLCKYSLPFSFVRGLVKSLRLKSPAYLFVHLFLDLAQFIGISSLFYQKQRVK